MGSLVRQVIGLIVVMAFWPHLSHAAGDAKSGYEKLGFDVLASFPFTPPIAPAPGQKSPSSLVDQVPVAIKAWHGRKVILTGYMMPVKTEGGKVVELLLTPNTMAAGNLNPFSINEWVVVKIRPGVVPQTLQPVWLLGTLKIGPIYEQGYLTGIYELTAERMSEVPVF